MARRTKTNAFDWAAIQWARLIEQKEQKELDEDRFTKRAKEGTERNKAGRLSDPLAFLSVRASAVLEAAGVSFERFRERAKRVWIFSLVLVVALGAVVFPLARVDKILKDVNLAGPFVFFLLGQIFFLTISLIFVLISAFQGGVRLLRSQKGPQTSAERTVARFSGALGWLAVNAIRWGTPLFYALAETKFFARFNDGRERGGASEESDESKAAAKARKRLAERLFWDLAFSKPRFLAFWSGTLSHLFWTSCSVCVLLILVARMQGNQYDYCWRTSLENAAAVKIGVDFLGTPLAKLGAEVPTRADVEALFDEESPRTSRTVAALDETETTETTRGERATRAETRTRWSHFLLGVVLFWCVAPRCCLTAAYYFLFRRALRDFRPDLEEPYFCNLIERAERLPDDKPAPDVPVDDGANDKNDGWDKPKRLRDNSLADADAFLDGKKDEVKKSDDEPVAGVGESVSVDEPVAGVGEPVSVDKPVASEESVPVDEPVASEESVPCVETIAVAFGYDATLPDERWRELFGAARTPVLFGDVASDFALKKAFKNWAAERGSDVGLCAVATDVSLPPARQCVIFFRDVLAASCQNARIVVVLSGGEKLRQKLDERGVAERIQDWTDNLKELARTTGVPFETVFYDADLDLPEPREALRKRLSGDSDPKKSGTGARRSFAKWDAAAERIVAECRAIFDESCKNGRNGEDETTSEERDRRRVALLCADIFEIYREEVEQATAAGVDDLERREGRNAWRENLLARAAAVVERSVEGGRAFGGEFVETCRANGLDRATLERKLTDAIGLSAKAAMFCKGLSPRCALAFGAVGVAIPVVATFAPLFAGAASTAAIASTLGSLGTLLPSTLASGATGAALGAVVPKSLAACKRKLVERWRGERAQEETNKKAAGLVAQNENSAFYAAVESSTTVVCVAATWAATLELQGWPEDKIVASLPVALRPVEEATFDSSDAAAKALVETRDEIRKLREN